MLGFRLVINAEEAIQAALPHGIVSVNLNRIKAPDRDECDLYFRGYVPETNKSIKWARITLKEGDKIEISLVEIESGSEPTEVKNIDPGRTILEGKLRAYNSLKKELEEKGLI